jgi:hypothetical protein
MRHMRPFQTGDKTFVRTARSPTSQPDPTNASAQITVASAAGEVEKRSSRRHRQAALNALRLCSRRPTGLQRQTAEPPTR